MPSTPRSNDRRFYCLGFAIGLALAGCTTEQEVRQAAPPTPPAEIFHTNYGEVNLFADSAHALTDAKVDGFKLFTGKTPRYWGRYLCNSTPEYDMTTDELDVFSRNQIAPILILQPGQDALSHGATFAHDAATCFKTSLDALKANGYEFPPDMMIFLDVETGTELSSEYLETLVHDLESNGILTGQARFGIYLSGAYSANVRTLINSEIANGLPISVAWFARYLSCQPLPYWQEDNIEALGKINVGTELWQYAANCHAYGPTDATAGFDLDAEKPPVYGGDVPVADVGKATVPAAIPPSSSTP